jgi:hypothetical protein
MPGRKTPPHNLRKRSFRAGYVLAFSFTGIALGFILSHRTPTPTEFQVQSPIGGNLVLKHSNEGAVLINSLEIVWTMGSPSPRPLPQAGGEGTGEGASACQYNYATLNNSTETKPLMSSPGDQEADHSTPSIQNGVRRIEEPGLREDALESLLFDLTGITPEDIPHTLSIQEFAAQVTAIATKDIWTLKEGGSWPEDSTVTDIRFGTSPRPPEPTDSLRTRFSTFDTRIFAVFDTSAYAYPSVLLRWCRVDQPELIILQKYEIDPHAASNYVWYNNREGWPSGQYRVEVYSLGENFRMMSSGQYEVSEN